METKELRIQTPEGYEIDKENSTFECIRFKPIKKDITYDDVCHNIFKTGYYTYYTDNRGKILHITEYTEYTGDVKIDKNNATNSKQLERILALNQLLNIAEYYNRLHPEQNYTSYCIILEDKYCVISHKALHCLFGVVALFNKKEDAQAVIDNPNFREILDTIYKG